MDGVRASLRVLWLEPPAASATLLSPACETCGCTLRATSAEHFARDSAEVTRPDVVPPSRKSDVTAAFAALVAVPMMLPIAGVDLGDFTFAVPFALLVFAAMRCLAAARREGPRRAMWTICAVTSALAAAAAGLAVATALAGVSSAPAFYLGAGGSLGLLVAMSWFAARSLSGARTERIVDAILFGLVVVALSLEFVAVPGLTQGGPVLTGIFVIDGLAALGASVAALARVGSRHRRIAWLLLGACLFAMTGDGIVALGHTSGVAGLLTALAWAGAAFAIAVAADSDVASPSDVDDVEWTAGAGWFLSRVVLPPGRRARLPRRCVRAVAGGPARDRQHRLLRDLLHLRAGPRVRPPGLAARGERPRRQRRARLAG